MGKSSSDPQRPLEGRNAVVTGGCRGLGFAISKALAAAGAAVTVLDLRTAIEEADIPSGWQAEEVDFAEDGFEDRIKEIAEDFTALDVLVANAGVVPPWRGVADIQFSEWETVFRINVAGMAFALKHFSRALSASPSGSVVLMASINAFKGHPSQILYAATKHAVLGLARSAALDLGRSGVRVNAIAPGPVATDALVGRIQSRHQAGGPAVGAVLDSYAEETALGRLATPGEVAETALFLASDRSHGITGAMIRVDTGLQ